MDRDKNYEFDSRDERRSRRRDYDSKRRDYNEEDHDRRRDRYKHRSSRSRSRSRGRSHSRSPDGRRDRSRRDNRYDRNERFDRSRSSRSFEEDRPEKPAGEPNQCVVLQNLSNNVSEYAVQDTLTKLGASFEEIRLIMDKRTGLPRGFAFVKFTSVEHARLFLERYYPSFQMDGRRIRLDYSNSPSIADDGWKCARCSFSNFRRRELCHQCGIPKQESATLEVQHYAEIDFSVNDGASDIGHFPHTTLLLRGLDPLTTEETIHTVLSLIAPVKKVLLIKDKMSHISWGYAFVEFSDPQTSSYVLAQVLDPRVHPSGFLIDNRPTGVTFAHHESFIPVYAPSSYTISTDTGHVLAYWDENAYPTVFPIVDPAVPKVSQFIGPSIPAEFSNSIHVVKEAKPQLREQNDVEQELDAFYEDLALDMASSEQEKNEIFSVQGMTKESQSTFESRVRDVDDELQSFFDDLNAATKGNGQEKKQESRTEYSRSPMMKRSVEVGGETTTNVDAKVANNDSQRQDFFTEVSGFISLHLLMGTR
ncbi:hypothetical protein K7432_010208 [Basidiobolus ranarum]|uniref:RNA-binding protein n=1 Tax=Basidiobolus ranarum TaxID=34480 RepID=A0ABR2WP41_9FUNG